MFRSRRMSGRVLAGATAVMIAGAVSVLAAPAASSNQTWVQSFQRSGPDAPCVAPAELDIVWQAGWTGSKDWTPSWEKWPNGGTGGWTCTRSITWAKDTPAPALPTAPSVKVTCVHATDPYWLDFGSGVTLPPDSIAYSDATCATPAAVTGIWFVYASNGEAAQGLCNAVAPGTAALNEYDPGVFYIDPDLYGCWPF
jgi:hypothetical protein